MTGESLPGTSTSALRWGPRVLVDYLGLAGNQK